MPHLRFRAVNEEAVRAGAAGLAAELAAALSVGADWFTMEIVRSEFLKTGCNPGNPFVEVLWFPRPRAAQDMTAGLLTDFLRRTHPGADATVVFISLDKAGYYENGASFA